MKRIKILDCTLRDGGYVNNWQFSNMQISRISSALEAAGIDIVEYGYLNQKKGNADNTTLFDKIQSIKEKCNAVAKNGKVVMINYGDYPIDLLPHQKESVIDGIRLAFHKKDLQSALEMATEIIQRGYKLYLQPMVTKTYTQKEFREMLDAVNHLMPYAFYIVDSFGSMTLTEFRTYLLSADEVLYPKIVLGYHAHNNMQLAFSNTIDMCHAKLQRDIIIDASIYGMGRGAGNLNTELIADYLNTTFHASYNTLPLLEIIDLYLSSYMKQNPWGFSPAQYLSARFDCHPNYATYLIGKNTNHIVNIRNILARLPQEEKVSFNETLAEKLYIDALVEERTPIKKVLHLDMAKHILLIASGKSVRSYQAILEEKSKRKEYLLIALNHIPEMTCDYYFFSNQKRFNEFYMSVPSDKLVVSNNIDTDGRECYVFPFQQFAFVEKQFIPNIAVVVLQYLISQGFAEVEVAGLDGYDLKSLENYSYNESTVITDVKAMKEENTRLAFAIEKLSRNIHILFVTPSQFQKSIPLKIIGVIPARYRSSRFEGKPLCMIAGVPMIKRTYMQAKQSQLLDRLVVATDDPKIEEYCKKEHIPVIMTSSNCLTGTDRIAEVAQRESFDLYVNIQGDEPVIDPGTIDSIVEEYRRYGNRYIAYNLYKVIDDMQEVKSNTIIKTVVNEKDELIYMSRHPIPFSKMQETPAYKKQVCVYGFTKRALSLFASRDKTLNEKYEDIEILRFVDMGYKVKMRETNADSIAVDIPDDVQKVERYLQQKGLES